MRRYPLILMASMALASCSTCCTCKTPEPVAPPVEEKEDDGVYKLSDYDNTGRISHKTFEIMDVISHYKNEQNEETARLTKEYTEREEERILKREQAELKAINDSSDFMRKMNQINREYTMSIEEIRRRNYHEMMQQYIQQND